MQYIWQRPGWPKLTWQNDALVQAIGQARFAQGKLLSNVHALGIDLGREAQAEILIEEAVKTAAIEGETLDRNSVRSSVARRLGLPFAGLPAPARHIDGLVDVLLEATLHFNKPLNAERLKGWQAALFPTGFSGLQRIRVGDWRGPGPMQIVSGPLGHEKIHFEAPPYQRIDEEMNRFFSWWHVGRGKIEGLLRAGIAHFYLVTIHPFEDGNGRIARALTDMALAQDEHLTKRFYSLSHHIMTDRGEYYERLEYCQKGNGDITQWLLWFLGCLQQAIENSESLIAGVSVKAKFWQKNHHVAVSPHQRKVINRLLDAEPAGFTGGLTTRKFVSLAKVSRVTAYREISDLVKKGILVPNQGKGRSISYRLVLEDLSV